MLWRSSGRETGVFENNMIQMEDAGINIRPAISALWNGERHCARLFLRSSFLDKLVLRDILTHVEERVGSFPGNKR